MRLVSLATCISAWLLLDSVACACGYQPSAPFEISSDVQDTTPPAAPQARVARVKRGRGPKQEGCGQVASSCDSIGYLLLAVCPADSESGAALGYVLEVRGDAPPGLDGSRVGPVVPLDYEAGQLRLVWEDGEGEQDFDFEIHVWSVDRAGNVSEQPTVVHVESSASGCSTAGSRRGAGSFGLILLALWVRRRRSRPEPRCLVGCRSL